MRHFFVLGSAATALLSAGSRGRDRSRLPAACPLLLVLFLHVILTLFVLLVLLFSFHTLLHLLQLFIFLRVIFILFVLLVPHPLNLLQLFLLLHIILNLFVLLIIRFFFHTLIYQRFVYFMPFLLYLFFSIHTLLHLFQQFLCLHAILPLFVFLVILFSCHALAIYYSYCASFKSFFFIFSSRYTPHLIYLSCSLSSDYSYFICSSHCPLLVLYTSSSTLAFPFHSSWSYFIFSTHPPLHFAHSLLHLPQVLLFFTS